MAARHQYPECNLCKEDTPTQLWHTKEARVHITTIRASELPSYGTRAGAMRPESWSTIVTHRTLHLHKDCTLASPAHSGPTDWTAGGAEGSSRNQGQTMGFMAAHYEARVWRD